MPKRKVQKIGIYELIYRLEPEPLQEERRPKEKTLIVKKMTMKMMMKNMFRENRDRLEMASEDPLEK
jgi:hypothetical protein